MGYPTVNLGYPGIEAPLWHCLAAAAGPLCEVLTALILLSRFSGKKATVTLRAAVHCHTCGVGPLSIAICAAWVVTAKPLHNKKGRRLSLRSESSQVVSARSLDVPSTRYIARRIVPWLSRPIVESEQRCARKQAALDCRG